jgi:glucokinase
MRNRGDCVLGIDLGGTKIALATSDTTGQILFEEVLSTRAELGAEQAITRALNAGRLLADRTCEAHENDLVAVGIATMGITLEDRVLIAPNVPGWDQLAIPSLSHAVFPDTRVAIDNDVKAAALAEMRWGKLAGINAGIYVNLGTGIATTLITNGRIIRGAHDAAGEIAYILRNPSEPLGYLDGHAPLEEFVGGHSINERIQQQFGDGVTITEIVDGARSNQEFQEFLNETLGEIAFHLTNLTIALDPERVVIGGGLIRARDIILPYLIRYFARFIPFPPTVIASHFAHNAGIMGAISLALDKL